MAHVRQVRSTSQRIALPMLRRLRAAHDQLARNLGPAFSDLLRSSCSATVAGLEESTYDQFMGTVESPACFWLLTADPEEKKGTVPDQPSVGARAKHPPGRSGKWGLSPFSPPGDDRLMLDIDPALLHSMIDRLLGGSGNEPPPGRAMTEIELCVAARVVRLFLDQCGAAWQGALDLKAAVLHSESDPRLSAVLRADESVFVISLELDVGSVCGLTRLCIPVRTIQRAVSGAGHTIPPAPDGSLDVAVTLAKTAITSSELSDLRVGDIVVTETPVTDPATVSVSGVERYCGKPGLYHGRKAVVILEEVSEPPSPPKVP